MLTDRFDTAICYASRLHRTQVRKGTRIPYIAHLLSVGALVIEHGGDEDQAIAALLHDAAEDQGGRARLEEIEDRFGPAVARIVSDCTDAWVDPKPPWRERKEAYISSLHSKPRSSLLVSLADKVHNARAIASDRRRIGDDIWRIFTGGKEGTLWYYLTLSRLFEEALPGDLSVELRQEVEALSRC